MCGSGWVHGVLCAAVVLLTTAALADDPPQVVDPRLTLTLFAEQPAIVTPIGLAVDGRGRVCVIESHTHFRPKDYQGPPADRIRIFEDTDGDGTADKITTFHEGDTYTMGLAIDPLPPATNDAGKDVGLTMIVATRREVFRLRDTDGDDKADHRTTLAKLETAGNYPHNGLSGFAFDFEGNIYFGLGENLGEPYKLIGADGTTLEGGGEGGNVYRINPEGKDLTRIATGFWNPFNMCVDAFGRLFAVDNDPDSRPPCRLVHVVPGGDYGFRFRNGRKGLHPFTAWNGELPGTLPMAAGTGEAPSGVVAYESDQLPDDYLGSLLVTSWGDHRIERYRLRRRGASFAATAEPIIQGGERFRPVGIATAPDGSLYVSDWVDRSYPLHGQGRIWRISAKDPPSVQRIDPEKDARRALSSIHRPAREEAARELAGQGNLGRQLLRQRAQSDPNPRVRAAALEALVSVADPDAGYKDTAPADPSPDVRELAVRILPLAPEQLLALVKSDASRAIQAEALHHLATLTALPPAENELALVLARLADADPFVRHAAVQVLRGRPFGITTIDPTTLRDPRQRLGLLLALRESSDRQAQATLPAFLDDPDATVRFAAVMWVGEHHVEQYRQHLVEGLTAPGMTPELFAAHLASLQMLDGGSPQEADKVGGEFYISAVLLDSGSPAAVRRLALRTLRPDYRVLTVEFLTELAESSDPGLALEAVRTLREGPHKTEAAKALAALARDTTKPAPLRAEAVLGLAPDGASQRDLLISLAADDEGAVRDEALRSLRGAELSGPELARLADAAKPTPAVAQLVARVVAPNAVPDRPKATDTDAWLKLLDAPADPDAGQRIFYHPRAAGCFRCHRIDGRGGDIGPDLSLVGRSLDRRRLIESIIQPSKEIAPRYFVWVIQTQDGQTLTVSMVDDSAPGRQVFADTAGRLITLSDDQIVSKRSQEMSIMPDGLTAGLTTQELRDLAAFLMTLK